MLAKRIIPCLDVKDGRTVKGINFLNLRDAGDPVELGARYAAEGADELVYLDICATVENRSVFADLVHRVAERLNIPFTAGGGVSSLEHVETLLKSGADKITINTAAVQKPQLISDMAKEFGSQCIVVAVDTRFENSEWIVYTRGGRTPTARKAVDWAAEIVQRGGGEILLTSMNNDGTKKGFALDITRTISENVPIPVIASGGAGTIDHFIDVFKDGKADAALAASVFHFQAIGISDLKSSLFDNNIPVRTTLPEAHSLRER